MAGRYGRRGRRGAPWLTILALMAAVLGLWWRQQPGQDQATLSGRVSISDGDSFAIDGNRVRLHGIDAPELQQTCERSGGQIWPCGKASRDALASLIAGQQVTCDARERDRHRRYLAICRTERVPDLNRRMVADGMAVAYGAYEAEERQARTEKKGLWAGTFERPRDWRDKHMRR